MTCACNPLSPDPLSSPGHRALVLALLVAPQLLACGASATDDGVGTISDDERCGGTDCQSDTGAVYPTRTEEPVPAECGGNILQGDLGDTQNWIGGYPDTDVDDPCGIQGPIYIYGDAASSAAAGLRSSCVIPEDARRTIACEGGRCCLSGATITDNSQSAWGCGIGIGLRHSAAAERIPYSEPGIVGFQFRVEGSLTEGQYIRVHLQQPNTGENVCSPFLGGGYWGGSPITPAALASGGFTGSVRFDEVECPDDTGAECGCVPPGPAPLDIQFQVTGGNVEGPYSFCLTSLSPLLE